MQIQFCGAARTVTGSCHLLTWSGGKALIDCGMRQGTDAKGEFGEDRFPFDPASIDLVLLTHAHIDHSGLIPLLVKYGFKGNILTTGATAQLATIMLPDSAHIQEQDAEWTNRKNERSGKPRVEPLYNINDAMAALKLFRPLDYGEVVQALPGLKVRFNDMGHLLGSASIEIWAEENGDTTKLVFSGDVGRSDRPIINDPVQVKDADYLIVEGTYGDRNHEVETDAEKENVFANVLRGALARGGNIVIPSFAVGRTQELLYYIKRILQKGVVQGLESVPVYIDSPLGIEATRIYERCAKDYYDPEAAKLAKSGSPFDFPSLRVAKTSDESKMINTMSGRNIIISSSGMCDAGRIRHHLKHNLYRADSTVVFAGYQAEGTLGRLLISGAKRVKLFGEDITVNADIQQIEGFSGHAGKDELVKWITNVDDNPVKVFLVHGEETSLKSLRRAIGKLGYEVEIPHLGDSYELKKGAVQAYVPEAATKSMDERVRGVGIRKELDRIIELLERVDGLRSPDVDLKLDILEEDVKALVDKWNKLL